MKIPELTYEIRLLARKEQDPSRKDLFYQIASVLEYTDDLVKQCDLAVCEGLKSGTGPIEMNGETKYPVNQEVLGMMDDFLLELVQKGYLPVHERWEEIRRSDAA
jgi:F0F1-type ATP synthase beta subunit